MIPQKVLDESSRKPRGDQERAGSSSAGSVDLRPSRKKPDDGDHSCLSPIALLLFAILLSDATGQDITPKPPPPPPPPPSSSASKI
jgi:hypothetical protein